MLPPCFILKAKLDEKIDTALYCLSSKHEATAAIQTTASNYNKITKYAHQLND